MSNETFYPLTSNTMEKLYKAKLTAAEWRLWSYLVVIDPWGDNYKDLPDTLTIMEKVGIKKSTFYAAIAKFQKFGLIDIQDKGFAFRNLQGSQKVLSTVGGSGKLSEISENAPESRKEIQNLGRDTEISENQPPEPAPSKPPEVPHTIQTYSDFLKTLSDTEKAEFDKFCKRRVKALDFEVKHVTAWLDKYHLDYWADFRSRSSEEPQQPQRREQESQEGEPAGRSCHLEKPTLKYLFNFNLRKVKEFTNAAAHEGYTKEEINNFLRELDK